MFTRGYRSSERIYLETYKLLRQYSNAPKVDFIAYYVWKQRAIGAWQNGFLYHLIIIIIVMLSSPTHLGPAVPTTHVQISSATPMCVSVCLCVFLKAGPHNVEPEILAKPLWRASIHICGGDTFLARAMWSRGTFDGRRLQHLCVRNQGDTARTIYSIYIYNIYEYTYREVCRRVTLVDSLWDAPGRFCAPQTRAPQLTPTRRRFRLSMVLPKLILEAVFM